MNYPLIDVNLAEDLGDTEQDWHTLIEPAVRQAVDTARLDLPRDSELSILVCGDASIQELNAKWRGKDKPTNVLSFPTDEHSSLLGDIVISLDTTQREADLENKSLHDHFTHLVVHGFLHLFGYDHENESDAVEMEQLETDILAALDIADPYKSE